MNRITLLTDFGTRDGYVAAVKGVLASMAPGVVIDDAGHDVPHGDVRAAAWSLAVYWHQYPPGTVHVIVVDPGVGGARRPLAARVRERFFVAPDNGVLTRVLADAPGARVVEIRNRAAMRPSVSHTFHGRDIFAGAAAWLARGDALDELGPVVSDPHRLSMPEPRVGREEVVGEVVHVDRFGNLITNIPESWALGAVGVRIEAANVGPVRRTYADVASGEPLALIGSVGFLEIAVRDGRATDALAAGRGTVVRVERYLPADP